MSGTVVHQRDESVPIEHFKHIGPVLRCTCGRDYVAGYRCAGTTTTTSRVPGEET
jgi:hypothetical protein